MENLIQKAADILSHTEKLLVLTGAGISTSAGIPDFRGDKGIYTLGTVSEDIFDLRAFRNDPKRFWEFGKKFIFTMEKAAPTPMHRFIKKLEIRMETTVVTQNIDGIHEKAGSADVIELHGSFSSLTCLSCGKTYDYKDKQDQIMETNSPICECGRALKPDIVFFGEPVQDLKKAFNKTAEADTMMIIGSSLTVYPASLLPSYFKGKMIVVNKGPVSGITITDLFLDIEADRAAVELSQILFPGEEI